MTVALEMLLFPFYFGLIVLLFAQESPEEKENIFAKKAGPAFFRFENVASLADVTVELPCRCKSEEAYSVVWHYQRHLASKDSTVITDFEGVSVIDTAKVGHKTDLQNRLSIRLFSLIIFRGQVADSGYYICGTKSNRFFYAYYLDIQKIQQVSLSPGSDISSQNPSTSRGSEQSPHFIVFNRYWRWSVCDRCGVPGELTRVGLCYLRSDYLNIRYRTSKRGIASCGSPAVPRRFQLDDSLTGAKLEVRECQVPCPAEPRLPSKEAAILEFLSDSTKGAGLPVYYQNHPVNAHIILVCPGANSRDAVAWDQGEKRMLRRRFMEGVSKTMRVYIDGGGRLHFHPVLLNDKGSYYCWLQGKLAADIRLSIYHPLGYQFQPTDPRTVDFLRATLITYAGFTSVFVLFLVGRCSIRYTRMSRKPKM
ncbi:Ig-like V-type domain-containing protein FAM187A [Paramormyrops kingsleyae]|uniref:Ig-like V-type domain-containing protein FAM187A n=1 Tax=Paramormyrops kingsleyae TaxID=1676925 RepID=UPI000CD6266B|nr:Ig-like V-type domain-containing protein FAM187A [Paramormyrops kingsleyae]